jgi:hypothetical protein
MRNFPRTALRGRGKGLPNVRCDAARPASQLREHRQRSRLYRGDHRCPCRSCQGLGHEQYIHALDTALIMAADTISGYIRGLLDGIEFKQTAYALDRDSRKAALARFLEKASGADLIGGEEERCLAAWCKALRLADRVAADVPYGSERDGGEEIDASPARAQPVRASFGFPPRAPHHRLRGASAFPTRPARLNSGSGSLNSLYICDRARPPAAKDAAE